MIIGEKRSEPGVAGVFREIRYVTYGIRGTGVRLINTKCKRAARVRGRIIGAGDPVARALRAENRELKGRAGRVA